MTSTFVTSTFVASTFVAAVGPSLGAPHSTEENLCPSDGNATACWQRKRNKGERGQALPRLKLKLSSDDSRIMAPSAVNMDQRRRRAVIRVMEKMLDDESLDQCTFSGMHDAFSVKLWKATRCMSGEEFLLAVEERVLGDGISGQSGGACAYPGCSVVWGATEASAASARVASGSCCSSMCAEHMSAHAARLGSVKDASSRFTGLYELAKREREEKLRLAGGSSAVGGGAGARSAGEAGSSGDPRSRNGMNETINRQNETNEKISRQNEIETSGPPNLAAGTTKTPIMHAVVKERRPGDSSGSSQAKRDQVFDADAVDGYRLKRQDKNLGGLTGSRRVRFAPEELLEQKREFRSQDPPGDVRKAPETCTAKIPADVETEPIHLDSSRQRVVDSPAQFVFRIEDPKGPVEEDMESIGDMFGTLNLLVPGEEGSSEEAHVPSSAHVAADIGPADKDTHRDNRDNGDNGGNSTTGQARQSVDAILARTLRDGAKHFPHLDIPEDIVHQIEALDTGLAEENTEADARNGDEDSELDGYENIDSDFFSTDEDEDVPLSCQKTFFTQIYTFFDYWITDSSIYMIKGDGTGPHAPPPIEPGRIPQVPEVVTAIQRFVSIGCTTLAARLCNGIDANASFDKQIIVDKVAKLVGTFRLDAALPAFDSKQWLVVCLAMLKALSAHSQPHLKELTETPAGATRVGEILGDAYFTGEELLAVVSLLLGHE